MTGGKENASFQDGDAELKILDQSKRGGEEGTKADSKALKSTNCLNVQDPDSNHAHPERVTADPSKISQIDGYVRDPQDFRPLTNPEQLTCPYCFTKFTATAGFGKLSKRQRWRKLLKHINDYHELTRIFLCCVCNFATPCADTIKSHCTDKHVLYYKMSEDLAQDETDQALLEKKALESLRKKILELPPEMPPVRYRCDVCHKDFATDYGLGLHIKHNHGDGII